MKHRAIVPIAAFTAVGRLPELRNALTGGLAAGLTVSEINEILIQLYAYAGFPRSLNALGTFLALVEERRAAGITDAPGVQPSPPAPGRSSHARGAENQTTLMGTPLTGPVFDFAPAVDEFIKAHVFGDIFGRDNLDWQSREIATVSALATLDGVESQLGSHVRIALNTGLTEPQLREVVTVLRDRVGEAAADRAANALDALPG
ncbi:carboxymuconolactone decarboxylase family protein [Catenuloplanes sp. NPDC051500]|uniref:carboxymuconolactone decarboxylase family protein n=1 Tax=Catenuloplanes sp. NPDC051500 TaxID=3363959 RepID=UPI0037B4D2C8